MYVTECTATLHAPLSALWRTWTDIDHLAEWDPREEYARLDGPFTVGTTGYSKQRGNPGGPFMITAVEEGTSWTVRCPMPGGDLRIGHRLTQGPAGQVHGHVRYEVRGPFAPLFRFVFAPRLRRELPASFAALERRAVQPGGGQ
ncbi:MAG TPA: SRPBCC family protein [Streptosporangiaceae bacterium]|nr:SRPBCC family protein [Streptosporangiaceae bacterium]